MNKMGNEMKNVSFGVNSKPFQGTVQQPQEAFMRETNEK